jgi:hypothetical protein
MMTFWEFCDWMHWYLIDSFENCIVRSRGSKHTTTLAPRMNQNEKKGQKRICQKKHHATTTTSTIENRFGRGISVEFLPTTNF